MRAIRKRVLISNFLYWIDELNEGIHTKFKPIPVENVAKKKSKYL